MSERNVGGLLKTLMSGVILADTLSFARLHLLHGEACGIQNLRIDFPSSHVVR
jgi:hypothetical protein